MARYVATERVGINAVERIVVKDIGWIFREQPIVDMGIDAHFEIVDAGRPTGMLLAAQVKTGRGNFHETTDAYIYYGSKEHHDYWVGHSLPVMLVAHLPESDETFAVIVDDTTAVETKKGWKITIPKTALFNKEAAAGLANAAMGTPREQKFRRLTLDVPLMRHVQAGGKVSVELEDWYNKSLGRSAVTVYVYEEDGTERVERDWFTYFVGMGMKELAESIFPWAIASVDEDFYEENMDDDESPDFDDYYPRDNRRAEIYPYSDSAGEVAAYRLRLDLNPIGEAFLTLSEHLDDVK